MNNNVEILRRYNRWRRGHALWNATADLPDPRVVGEAIDAACDEIERLRVQVSALEAEREDLRCVTADISAKCASLCAERDRLRAELAECKRDAYRYRWLREKIENDDFLIARVSDWGFTSWCGDDPDRYIDAALAAKGEE